MSSTPKRTGTGVQHDRASQITPRSHRDWRGRGRHLPDQAAGRPRGGRCGAGSGPRPRWNLVLEPLSGSPFRLRELYLWLFVLEGIAERMALEGTLLGSTGESSLSEPCRR